MLQIPPAALTGTSECVALSADQSVWRCFHDGRSFIVKGRHTHPDDPRSTWDTIGRERVALEFVARIDPPVAPRLINAHAEWLVIEDLGPTTLSIVLMGSDRAAAEAGVLAYARTLGRLHAATAGSREGAVTVQLAGIDLETCWERLKALVAELSMAHIPSRLVEAEVERLWTTLRSPGIWLAMSAGDPCPGNVILHDDVATLIDFEGWRFQHAALDAASLRFPFVWCTPWACLPPDVASRAERAYRSEFRPDEDHEGALAGPMAALVILRLIRLRKVDAEGPQQLRRRTQIVRTIDAYLASACDSPLRSWMLELVTTMRSRWPEGSRPPHLYPAFAGEDPPDHR